MSTVTEQLQALQSDVRGVRTRMLSLNPNDIIFSALGEVVLYGCKVVETSSGGEMMVGLEGQAVGDSAALNPYVEAEPSRGFEYPNIASLKDGAFRSTDLTADVDTAPATGLGRYDIAYIYVGPSGAGFAVATGTPSASVKSDYDGQGLDTEAYLHSASFDPDLPVGAMPVARLYVEDDLDGIPQSRIADLRIFSDAGYSNMASVYAGQASDSAAAAAASETAAASSQGAASTSASNAATSATESEQWAITPVDVPVPASGSAMDFSSLHWATKSAESATDAEEWAITPEDVPVPASGSAMDFSSLHWAAKSQAFAGEAEQWAVTAEDVLVPASGSAMEYSSYHWALKSAASAAAAASSYDSFDDRYLGAKAADPTLDNDGNALITGALYFNSSVGEMRVRNSAGSWVNAGAGTGYLPLTGGTLTGTTLLRTNAAGSAIYVEANVDSTGSNSFQLRKARGSSAARTSVQSGDNLGQAIWYGFDGTDFVMGARIEAAVDGTPGTNDMPGRLIFSTSADGASSPTERMRIDSVGRVGIGITPNANSLVRISKSVTGDVTQYGILSELTGAADVTSVSCGFTTSLGTVAGSHTLANVRHFNAGFGATGAGATITNQDAFYVASGLSNASVNRGFNSNLAADGYNDWNAYMSGAAPNYFSGDALFGTTTPGTDTAKVDIVDSTGFCLTLGNSVVNSTDKSGRITSRHYLNVEEGLLLISGISTSTAGNVTIGGGTAASGNAATEVSVFTAANNSTLSGTKRWKWDGSGHYLPEVDNTYNIGGASNGVKEIFCDNGTINTSDARRKTNVVPLTANELAASIALAREIGTFKFLQAIADKGEEDARTHIGMTVQRAIEIMTAHTLDPMAYSFICFDAWPEEVGEVQTTADDPEGVARVRHVQHMETRISTRTEVEVIEGQPTRVTRTVGEQVKAFVSKPVLDESGQPIMELAEPENSMREETTADDPEGQATEVAETVDGVNVVSTKYFKTTTTPAVLRPLMHSVPVMDEITEYYKTAVTRPAGDKYSFRVHELTQFILRGLVARLDEAGL